MLSSLCWSRSHVPEYALRTDTHHVRGFDDNIFSRAAAEEPPLFSGGRESRRRDHTLVAHGGASSLLAAPRVLHIRPPLYAPPSLPFHSLQVRHVFFLSCCSCLCACTSPPLHRWRCVVSCCCIVYYIVLLLILLPLPSPPSPPPHTTTASISRCTRADVYLLYSSWFAQVPTSTHLTATLPLAPIVLVILLALPVPSAWKGPTSPSFSTLLNPPLHAHKHIRPRRRVGGFPKLLFRKRSYLAGLHSAVHRSRFIPFSVCGGATATRIWCAQTVCLRPRSEVVARSRHRPRCQLSRWLERVPRHHRPPLLPCNFIIAITIALFLYRRPTQSHVIAEATRHIGRFSLS